MTVPARLRIATIVSTPRDLALIDARRDIAMFRRAGVTVRGIVESMNYVLCPQCGMRSDIFGHVGARPDAQARWPAQKFLDNNSCSVF
jgi:ATP-binding protein involved in chromosome partitioning